MKKPDLVRMAAGELMTWLLTYEGKQKPSEEGFLGWTHLVERDLFVINDKALSAIKGRFFSLENIVPPLLASLPAVSETVLAFAAHNTAPDM